MADVSIIIPVYNLHSQTDGADYFRAALWSAVEQSVPPCEVIVVDDGSDRDGLALGRQIVSELSDCRRQIEVRLIEAPHGGVSRARNLGVERARGRYVSFVDADDILLPDALKCLTAPLKVNPDIDMVVGRITRSEPAATLADIQPVASETSESLQCDFKQYRGIDYLAKTLYQRGGHNSPCGCIIRRNGLVKHTFLPDTRYEDLELVSRLYPDLNIVAVVPQTVYYYRDTAGSFINTWHEGRCDVLTVTDRIISLMAETAPQVLPAAKSRALSARFDVFGGAVRNRQPRLARECFEYIKQNRLAALLDRQVRIKNKLGSLASYLGFNVLAMLARCLTLKNYHG